MSGFRRCSHEVWLKGCHRGSGPRACFHTCRSYVQMKWPSASCIPPPGATLQAETKYDELAVNTILKRRALTQGKFGLSKNPTSWFAKVANSFPLLNSAHDSSGPHLISTPCRRVPCYPHSLLRANFLDLAGMMIRTSPQHVDLFYELPPISERCSRIREPEQALQQFGLLPKVPYCMDVTTRP